MTDDLLQRLQNGEAAARQELFGHCQTRLRRYFQSRLPNPGDVGDCVSEVVTRALETIRNGAQPEVLNAWLFGIARNVLKERYEAKTRDGGEFPADLPEPPTDPQLDLEQTDLPQRPSDLEIILGKKQLWAMLSAAAGSINPALAAIMRAHIKLSWEKRRLVVGAELAAALDRPVENVTRELNRSRAAMRSAIVALVLARTGRGDCPALAQTMSKILRTDQLSAGRDLVLDHTQTADILKHAAGCAACTPRAKEARDYSRWALGPGLVGLAGDDEERRRAVIAMLDRAGESPLAAQAPTAAVLTAIPATPLTTADPAVGGLLERVRVAVAARVALLPRPDAVVQFAQENPDAFRRIVVAVVSGVVVIAAVVIGMLTTDPGGRHDPAQDALPPPTSTTTTTPPATIAPPTAAQPPPPVTTTPALVAAPQSPTATTSSTRSTTTTSPSTTTTAPPPPPADPVAVDATDTDYDTFAISGVEGWHNTDQVQRAQLAPGLHTVTTKSGQTVDFQVTEDRRVEYDRGLDGILTGRGTSTLAVHGQPVTVDVAGLDYANVTVNGIDWRTPQSRHTYKLLPGLHQVLSNNFIHVPFTVSRQGQVGYESSWDGIFSGATTTMLAVHGLVITVNMVELDYPRLTIEGINWRPAQPSNTYRVLPGSHQVLSSNSNYVPFTVNRQGNVTYEATWNRVLTGSDTATLAVHGLPVTLDVTDLDYQNTGLSGTYQTQERRHVFKILPGANSVLINFKKWWDFTVTPDGHVDYDSALQGRLTGSGSSTLAAHGLPVTLDVTDLDYANTGVSGTYQTQERRHVFKVLPGVHSVVINFGKWWDFTVTPDGHVDYDPALQGTLTGSGSDTLGAHGLPITLDVTDVSYQQAGISGTYQTPDRRHTFKLLPNPHYVVINSGRSMAFTVTPDGHIDYNPALHGRLTGTGTSTLAIHGLPITLDATDVDYGATGIGGTVQNANDLPDYKLLPGPHYLVTSNMRSMAFTVTPDGHVAYNPALQGRLTGAGTSTLAMHGLPITLDVTDVDYERTGIGGTYQTRERTHVFKLLPNPHYLVINSAGSMAFTVTPDGHVDYDRVLQGRLTGSGGTILAVHGFPIVIDARDSGYPNFVVGGVGRRESSQLQTVRLLPGGHYLDLPGGGRVVFVVTGDGHVDYDHSLDAVLSGRGSATLTVRRPRSARGRPLGRARRGRASRRAYQPL